MSSLSRQQLESWLKNIDVKGNVLDIGGGQKSLEGRVKSLKSNIYHVLDINEKFNPDYLCDINEKMVNKITDYNQIFCLEVSEYFYDPVTAIENIFWCLKNGGELYISFHFVYPLHKPDGDDMLRYTRNWINKVFQMVGFRKVEITDRVATNGLLAIDDFYRYEKMKAYKETGVIGYLVKATK